MLHVNIPGRIHGNAGGGFNPLMVARGNLVKTTTISWPNICFFVGVFWIQKNMFLMFLFKPRDQIAPLT